MTDEVLVKREGGKEKIVPDGERVGCYTACSAWWMYLVPLFRSAHMQWSGVYLYVVERHHGRVPNTGL